MPLYPALSGSPAADDAFQVPDAIAVTVLKRPRVNLVNDPFCHQRCLLVVSSILLKFIVFPNVRL